MKPKKIIKPKNMYTYHLKEMLFVSTYKKSITKFCLYMALLLLAILIFLLPFIINRRVQEQQKHLRYPTDLKHILFWDTPKYKKFFQKDFGIKFQTGQRPFVEQKCSYINCYITYNRSLLDNNIDNFDAVVFDVHMVSKFKITDHNHTRPPYQDYIFWSFESAEKQPICNPMLDDFFTLTWTYRLDSDIPHPFFSIYDVNKTLVGPKKEMDWIQTMTHSDDTKNKDKNKAIAWVVSKCRLRNKFKDYVKELKEELKGYNYTLDVYGPCGEKRCPGGILNNCYKLVEKHYYFQLVPEESSAEDYVTEKIVKALGSYTVPIVVGGANYSRFLPPGSYVNAQVFDMKKLGALIDYLIKNPVMYQYFFDWKNHYSYTANRKRGVCELCEKLNTRKYNPTVYEDFRKWWNPEYSDICERLHLLDVFYSR